MQIKPWQQNGLSRRTLSQVYSLETPATINQQVAMRTVESFRSSYMGTRAIEFVSTLITCFY